MCSMKVLVIYATETGSSEIAAFDTYLTFYRRGLPVDVYNASAVSLLTLFSYDYTILFIPTAAFGEFPRSFAPLLDSIIASGRLPISYTIFGLGDSRYPLYNYAARKLQTLLDSLGATRFFPVAFGDDQHPLGYDGELAAWRRDLLSHLLPDYLPSDHTLPPDHTLPDHTLNEFPYTFPYCIKEGVGCTNEPKRGVVKGNRVITSETHFMDVHSVWIEGEFETGDVCSVYPEDDRAEEMLKKLNFDPEISIVLSKAGKDHIDTISSIRSKTGGWTLESLYRALVGMGTGGLIRAIKARRNDPSRHVPLGTPITLLELFRRYLCLSNTCTQFQMYVMAFYAQDKLHRDKLLEMSQDSVEGILEYHRYCKRERRSLFEVLYDFSSVNIPLDVLINIATPMYPRLYSIASIRGGFFRPFIHPMPFSTHTKWLRGGEVGFELIVAKTKYDTPSGRSVDGLCSNYLINLKAGDAINYCILRSQYSGLLDISRPALFICTGTGISACKPYMEARAAKFIRAWRKTRVLPKVKDVAFLGFRRPNQDTLYTDTSLVQGWCTIHYVFSRATGKKYYVQDALLEQASTVYEILLSGIVMISGKSHPMPASVLDAFRTILMQEANFGQTAANKFIDCSLKEKKIVVDTWG